MTIVYLVTSGQYSDYRIDGAFSTREKAEEFIRQRADEGMSVEEWALDTRLQEEKRTVYWCRIVLGDGAIDLESSWEAWIAPEEGRGEVRPPFGNQIYVQSYVSKEHARKLAAEARQEWLRIHGMDLAEDEDGGRGRTPEERD